MQGKNRIINTLESDQYYKQSSVQTCEFRAVSSNRPTDALASVISFAFVLRQTVLYNIHYDLQFTTKYLIPWIFLSYQLAVALYMLFLHGDDESLLNTSNSLH